MGYFEETKPEVTRSSQKILLNNGTESVLNIFIERRDAVVYKTEYIDGEGYNPYHITRFYMCIDNKSECAGLCMQLIDSKTKGIINETYMSFDNGFKDTLENLVAGNTDFKSYYGNVSLFVNNYYQGEK